jgi:hypothetical protein
MAKGKGGFIGQDGLNAPDAPTDVSGSGGDQQVSVSFTSPSDVGGSPITAYRVQDSTGAHGATGSSSPVTVTGLTNGTSYTFNVWAINAFGWSVESEASGSISPVNPIGFVSLGFTSAWSNSIDRIAISTTGNATDFGDLTYTTYLSGSCASSTRGIIAGGERGATKYTTINYITIATTGNAASFGSLTRGGTITGLSNSTRGVFGGGDFNNVMDYITIATTGNATDFGDLNQSIQGWMSLSSPTRGVFAAAGATQDMQYITIASTGNVTNFGNLANPADDGGGVSSGTRGVYGGDGSFIQYITIATTGNATSFGSLTSARGPAGVCSTTRGVFAGGSSKNNIDYITIATTGNATDFGDMTATCDGPSGSSNAHGGL